MTERSPAEQAAVKALLDEMEYDISVEGNTEAVGYITEATWDGGTSTFHGLYPDAVTALAAAEEFEAELNQGIVAGEEPYKVKVWPLLKGRNT